MMHTMLKAAGLSIVLTACNIEIGYPAGDEQFVAFNRLDMDDSVATEAQEENNMLPPPGAVHTKQHNYPLLVTTERINDLKQRLENKKQAEQPDQGNKPDGVSFANVADGDMLPKGFTLKFQVSGKTVAPAGEPIDDETIGHHHLIIGAKGIDEGTPVPADARHIHFGKGQTAYKLDLEKGQHRLTLQFADGAHRSYGPDWAKTITVNVVDQSEEEIEAIKFRAKALLETRYEAGDQLANPLPVTAENLSLGQTKYNQYCALCHGMDGKGAESQSKSPATERGVAAGANLTTEKLYKLASERPGEIFHVMTVGWNTMGSYAGQLEPLERWAIVHYIHTLGMVEMAKRASQNPPSADE